MHIFTASYNQNSNIGLFCYANDSFCLVPYLFPEKLKKGFKEALKVPVYEIKAAGTDLLGVFFSGNENCLLVPKIIFESELEQLRKLKIKYKVIDSELTALGNNLLIANKMCIANPDYDESVLKEIKDALDVEVKKGRISGLNIVGSLAAANKKGCLASPDIKNFEKKFLEDSLKLKVAKGSVNFGSPYVRSGIVCNSNGFVIGEKSGGPEVQNADEALGFLEV